MKKIKRFATMFLTLISMFSLLMVSNVSAMPAYNMKLQDGIRNQYCWFDSSVSGYWSTPYYNGINRWYNTSTWFSFTPTTNHFISRLDFYTYYNTTDRINGFCDYFLSGGATPNPNVQNWLYCEIYMNRYALQNTTTEEDTGLVLHEIGHAMGFLHYTLSLDSVMFDSLISRPKYPTQIDVNAVNVKYP